MDKEFYVLTSPEKKITMTEKEFFRRYSFNVREDKIGGGSFGTVYKAYDNVLDREVAVKVSEVRISGDKEFSLRAEFKAIEKLPPHANIANYEEVHTFESFNGVFDYAIMQYYPLGNLDHFLSTNNLDQAKKESLVLAILEGISHLHEHHIVQRDLKPSNILVVDRKGKLVPKITDFGLSKAAGDGKASRFTNSFAGGTLQYCSPEQIKGLPLKLNTDLWSFGAIAYEIFIGEALFKVSGSTSASAEWQNEVSKKILHEDYSEKLKQLPGNWPSVVVACLERDMEQRVQNAGELLSILKGSSQEKEDHAETQLLPGIDNDDTQIFSKSTSEEEPEPFKTKPVVPVEQVKKEAAKAQPTKPEPKRKNTRMWFGIAAGLAAAFAIGYFFTSTSMAEASETGMARELVLFEKDSLFGYKIGDSTVIEPIFKDAENFHNNRAKVTTADSTFYINGNGDWIGTFTVDKELKEEELAETNSYESVDVEDKGGKNHSNDNGSKVLSLAEQKKLFEKGKKLHNNKQYNEAYDLLLPVAKAGYMDAQRFLGHQFYFGYGHSKDYKKASEWYSLAAKQGDPSAQNNLGAVYATGGFGINKDYQEAHKWYIQSAKNGNETAMDNLADFYKNGNGVKQNYGKALEWYLKAAAKGNGDAMHSIGIMYRDGKGVDQDYQSANDWFEKAFKNGDEWGAYNLGRSYYHSHGVTKDYEKAIEWFNKAAEQGHSEAMAYIGNYYDVVKESGFDWKEARRWYEKAANNGSSWGKRALGEFYLFGVGGVTKDENKAKKLFTEAANAGDDNAKLYLQVIFDLKNEKYYQLDNSKLGNRFFVSKEEIKEEYPLSPSILENYSNSWTTELSYGLGSSIGVQIFPQNPENTNDKIRYSRYSPSTLLQDDFGTKLTSIGWDSYPSGKYTDGTRQIGYMYFQAHFYNKDGSKDETLRIKIPAMLCWKPKHYYE